MKTVSFELSKKLSELGFEKLVKPTFCWYKTVDDNFVLLFKETAMWYQVSEQIDTWTADEVIGALPMSLSIKQKDYFLIVEKMSGFYSVKYVSISGYCYKIWNEKQLPDALARVIIYLIENGFVEVPK